MERLQKVIAESGLTSRRKAEELIKDGKVKVNDEIVTELGTKVKSSDKITVNGELLTKENKEYYLLNKPRGVITSTSDEKNRKTVVDLIETESRIYPVGRLDYDTTGVVLLTNDGEFANILTHPKNNIEKEYIAKLDGIIKGESIHILEKGIKLDNQLIIPSKVKLKKVNKEDNTCIVKIIVYEGKNHEIKRLFESVGYKVTKLKRERIGIFTLGDLKSGKYRKLTPKEVAQVYGLKSK